MRLSKSSAYKFIAINIYIKKESNLRLSSIMRNQGENGVNPTQSKHEEIKKILAKISDIEKRKITEKKINKIKFGSLKRPTILKIVTLKTYIDSNYYIFRNERGNNYQF